MYNELNGLTKPIGGVLNDVAGPVIGSLSGYLSHALNSLTGPINGLTFSLNGLLHSAVGIVFNFNLVSAHLTTVVSQVNFQLLGI